MKLARIITLVAVIGLFTAQAAVAQTSWTTIDFPGATTTQLYGIQGNTVVGMYIPEGGSNTGFTYNGTTWTTVTGGNGVQVQNLSGISGNDLIGSCRNSYSASFYNGSTWSFLTAPGSFITEAFGIQGNYIFGGYFYGYEPSNGFVYNVATSAWTTVNYPGAVSSGLCGMQGSSLVGNYYASNYNPSSINGFLYNPSTGLFTTLDMPGADGTAFEAAQGQNIVGFYYDAEGNYDGFLYNGSTWTTLDMPGAIDTMVTGIDGNNIVGDYVDADGVVHGFEATVAPVPEPLTLAAVGMGIAALGGYVRRRRASAK